MKVPVWGWAKAGTTVTVEFAGQKKTAKAGKDEKWTLELDALKASAESREMTISDSTGKKEVLKDILVGEVWMCSGQSNMQWPASKCIVGRKLQKEIAERVAAGKEKQPIIREGKVSNLFSAITPRARGVKAGWSKDWGGFSAIAFAFIYEIEKELKIPVGILNCSFSTTKIQAWIPREGFAAGKDAYTQAIYKQILEGDHRTTEHKAAYDAYYKDLQKWAKDSADRVKAGRPVEARPGVPGNMNGNRDSCWMGNGKITPMAPYAVRGGFWNQGYASSGEGLVYRNNLHSLTSGWRAIWNRPDMPIYFHQFYAVGNGGDGLSLNSTGEMRLGTWLAHKDIKNAAMASQIDITGGVHYYNKAVPGQRLALHALKNQYGKDIIANGPMYKDYTVKGSKLVLELDHADGLCIGQSHTVRGDYANPVPVKDAEVTLFYLAGKDRTWHKAKITIVGKTIELTADGLKEPCGVAYGTNGVGRLPSIYNRAMLPLTPFIFFEKKLVISKQWDVKQVQIPGFEKTVEFMTWPDEYLKVSGVVRDPRSFGLQEVYRKLWLLAPQFTHNCVIQADTPIRFYGKAVPKSVVKITFAGTTKSMTMGAEQDEYEMTFPALKASAEPKTLHAVCTLDDEIAHERTVNNVVIGDVWYVAAMEVKQHRGAVPRSGPAPLEAWKDDNPQLRMFMSYGRRQEGRPTRFKMNASGNPISRAFPRWSPTVGITTELAKRIHAKTKKPVGIIVLDTPALPTKAWAGYETLKKIPAWKADVEQLKPMYEQNPATFQANTSAFITLWKDYWKSVAANPYFESGAIPRFPGAVKVSTNAATAYNQSICAFTPGSFKAVLCLTGKGLLDENEGADFGRRFPVIVNCWKDAFAWGKQTSAPHFVYSLPTKDLAPKLTKPSGINGVSTAIELKKWPVATYKTVDTVDPKTKRRIRTYNLVPDADMSAFLDSAIKAVYK